MKYFVILILMLVFSALYFAVKERASGEYEPPVLSFYSPGITIEPGNEGSRVKNRLILIADISPLTLECISDSAETPFLYAMMKDSRVFSKAFTLSPDRKDNLESFFQCLPPYRIYGENERFGSLKQQIGNELRNSSVTKEFGEEGYLIRGFFNSGGELSSAAGYFDSVHVCGDRIKMTESVFYKASADRNRDFLYYADMTRYGDEEHYMKRTDELLKKLSMAFSERFGKNFSVLLISTAPQKPLSASAAVFHGFGLEPYVDCVPTALTDISRTLMKANGLRIKNYFAGYDLSEGGGSYSRDYLAGESGDTLLLFNDSVMYKKAKFSDFFALFDRATGEDMTGYDACVNEKYDALIPDYFGGDYVKYLVFFNRTDRTRTFKADITSKRRFSEFGSLNEYYELKRRNYRYGGKIERELGPGMADTVMIYYSSLYQEFRFDFKEKLDVRYGPLGLNAGQVKVFEENSYYGTAGPETEPSPQAPWDVQIFSRRINY